ncbi:hypothetical protein PT276_01390 [Orbaceae bacterium ESL0721]|nr:hypothetical protein [Orbaceae bacterium ESL0721]
MINTLWQFVKQSFITNKYSFLLGLALIVIYQLGLNNGKEIAKQEYMTIQTQQSADALNQFINGTKQLTQAANEASRALLQQLVERKVYDEQSTKALQEALNKTSDSRSVCVFNDSVLQFIDAARARAVRATTDGIASDVSSTVRNSLAAQK